MLEIQNTVEGTVVYFSGELSIFDAQALFEALKPVLQEKQDLTFDLSNIVSIDTSVIQNFMFAKSLLKHTGHSLHLVNHSQAVLDLMERLGLVNWFNDPVFISPQTQTEKEQGQHNGATS